VTLDWTKHFPEQVGNKLAGSFKGADFRGSLADGTVNVVAWNKAITADQMTQIKAAEADIKSGKLHIFGGPLRDQAGTERVAAGATLPDADIFGMNWLVEGLQGSLPK
jgi:simple sugar transport system substrate-binding protein